MKVYILFICLVILSSLTMSCDKSETGVVAGTDPLTVTGIRIIGYDTLNGVVTLSWNKSHNPDLFTYLVYRDGKEAYPLSEIPINTRRIIDTVYQDTLFSGPGDTATQTRELEYRVCIQDKKDVIGESREFVYFSAAPPSAVRVDIQLIGIGGNYNTNAFSINDTIKVVAHLTSASRKISGITWFILGPYEVLRTIEPKGLLVSDTLKFVRQNEGEFRVGCGILDETGTIWSEGIDVLVLWDKPVAEILEGTKIKGFLGDTLVLNGHGKQDFGKIVKWEWNVGPEGNYVTYPDSVLRTVISKNNVYKLRITDDDGFVDSASTNFTLWTM